MFFIPTCLYIVNFFTAKKLRKEKRKELEYSNEDNVYVYSGGVGSAWHVPASFLRLFEKIAMQDEHAKMLVMTVKANDGFYKVVNNSAILRDRVKILEGIPNAEIVGYLNAGDFGILLRENYILNNVANILQELLNRNCQKRVRSLDWLKN